MKEAEIGKKRKGVKDCQRNNVEKEARTIYEKKVTAYYVTEKANKNEGKKATGRQ